MKNIRPFISLVFSLGLIIGAYAFVDYANSHYWVDDVCINPEKDKLANTFFFVAIPLYSFLTANTLVGIFIEKKEWLYAAFFRLTSVLALGAVVDELFGSNPLVASHGEWFFSVLSIAYAVLEYNNVKPLTLLCYLKEKIWRQVRS